MPRRPRRKSADQAGSDELAARVGSRIRRLRGAQNISLSKLAAQSGLAKGTLSELENGHRNPTLDTLFAITTALGTPLSSLLADAWNPSMSGEAVEGAGVRATLLLRHQAPDGWVEVYVLSVSTREQHSAPHRAGVTETLVVLEGRIVAGDPERPHVAAAGDIYTYRGDLPHLYRAEGGPAIALLLMRYPIDAGAGAGQHARANAGS